MAVPAYIEFFRPILDVLSCGKSMKIQEIRSILADSFRLSADDLAELLPSKKLTVFNNRTSWAVTYLVKAGLLIRPARGTYQITPKGLDVQKDIRVKINSAFLSSISSEFAEFHSLSKPTDELLSDDSAQVHLPQSDISPDEMLEDAIRQLNTELADQLLQEILNKDFIFFEHLVVKLLLSMGYGGSFNDSAVVTTPTKDGGIDGIIKEDKLGFSNIYIQAKRWNPDHTVNKPDIQQLSGALHENGASKGLFITTSKFSSGAKDSAKSQNIVLVDGEMLTRLMIEYNVGVSVAQTYYIKKLDTDFFSDDN